MSGHSKWSTIKHKKAAEDSRRGQMFTKLGRAITIAAKEGGGDVETNFKLRMAVDKARGLNMPKVNIDRAIERGSGGGGGEGLVEAVYEGFGPGKIAVMVEIVTDNKNRTAAELKKLFERSGGVMGQPGTVGFMFKKAGVIRVGGKENNDELMLQIIDLGVDDVVVVGELIKVVVKANQLGVIRDKLEGLGLKIEEAGLEYMPVSEIELGAEEKEKAVRFLDSLDDHDDVQDVYTNLKE